MKGAAEALSAILVTGILISVVGSVYFWGLPLIQKNKDIATLESAEKFMLNLDNKIKSISNSGGRGEVKINVPGILAFDGNALILVIETQGTQYAKNAMIPLGKNDCNVETGVWGSDEPDTFCVYSQEMSENEFNTTYILGFIQLDTKISSEIKGPESYRILLDGLPSRGGEGRTVLIENMGAEKESLQGGRSMVKTKISIKIQT